MCSAERAGMGMAWWCQGSLPSSLGFLSRAAMPREGAKVIFRFSCCFIRVPGGFQVAQLWHGESEAAPGLGLGFGGASHNWRKIPHCIFVPLLCVFRAHLDLPFSGKKR